MGAAFVITLREGIEAALIVSILLAYLRQLGRQDLSRLVWWGTALAFLVSFGIGTAIFVAGAEFEGRSEEIFGGLATLIAVGVLTWMIFWMRRQGARIKAELEQRANLALVAGGGALAALAFFAVLREGIETALFLFAAAEGTAVKSGGVGGQLLGAILGLALAIVLAMLLYRGAIRMNLRSFFRLTGLILIVVAAGLFANGIHELQEAGWFPFLEGTAFDFTAALPDDGGFGAVLRGLLGYNADPTTLEVIAWLAYLVIVGAFYLRPVTSLAPSRPAIADGTSDR
ncbi:MAG TPA: iron uptake transporter permease EfeU [Actinomycetota bacterium]|nr:iron uptake transporter permease EfeU [Actinomycetota bacterium]